MAKKHSEKSNKKKSQGRQLDKNHHRKQDEEIGECVMSNNTPMSFHQHSR